MIFKYIFYKDGCIQRVGDFDIVSVKLSTIKFRESYGIIGQIMLKNLHKKLFFNVSMDLIDLYLLKKKVSKKNVCDIINKLNSIQYKYLKLVKVNYYLPDNLRFYRIMTEQEVYL